MNFLCGDGYGIAKLVPSPPRCHPYLLGHHFQLNTLSLFELVNLRVKRGESELVWIKKNIVRYEKNEKIV